MEGAEEGFQTDESVTPESTMSEDAATENQTEPSSTYCNAIETIERFRSESPPHHTLHSAMLRNAQCDVHEVGVYMSEVVRNTLRNSPTVEGEAEAQPAIKMLFQATKQGLQFERFSQRYSPVSPLDPFEQLRRSRAQTGRPATPGS